MPQPDYIDEEDLEMEEIEAYCVSCKQKVVMENPVPVWTRRGAPGTRGTCEICGTTVFRMGRTEAHSRVNKPDTTPMFGDSPRPSRKKGGPSFAAYINYSPEDADMAARIAEDLGRMGIPTWFDPEPAAGESADHWASGVRPGLIECSHMVVIMSGAAAADEQVTRDWGYFREQHRPVLVAAVSPSEIPDDLRSRPRFDFADDYKMAFRRLSQALFE